jgi:hypothetical protein
MVRKLEKQTEKLQKGIAVVQKALKSMAKLKATARLMEEDAEFKALEDQIATYKKSIGRDSL